MIRETAAIVLDKRYVKVAAIRRASRGFLCVAQAIGTMDDAQISRGITAIFDNMRIKPSTLYLVIARNLITVRLISLPSANPKEISKMIDLHLVRLVPYKKEDVLSTHSVLYTDDVGYTKVFLCILHKAALNRQLNVLAQANIFPDKIYISSYGIWSWFLFNVGSQMDQEAVYFGLDIDSDFTELIAFKRDNLFFSRSIDVGSRQLTEQSAVTKLIKEVKQAIILMRSEYNFKKPEKIIISGAINNLAGLPLVLEKELEIPVKLFLLDSWINRFRYTKLNIPENVSISGLKEFFYEDKKRISFYAPETQVRKAFRQEIRDLVFCGSLLIYIFFIISGIFLGRLYNQERYLTRLNAHFANLDQETATLIKKNKSVLFVDDVLEARKIPTLILRQIYKAVPNNVALNHIGVDADNEVVLRGESLSLADVFSFVGDLKKYANFKDPEAKYTRKKKTRDGEITTFEIGFIFNGG